MESGGFLPINGDIDMYIMVIWALSVRFVSPAQSESVALRWGTGSGLEA